MPSSLFPLKPRVARRLAADPDLAEEVRAEAAKSFNFPTNLDPRFAAKFTEELVQILRFGAFVVAQKLVLYRVLEDAGPRRADPFSLDALSLPAASTDPQAIRPCWIVRSISRSKGQRTTRPRFCQSRSSICSSPTRGAIEARECRVGQAWHLLLEAVVQASWLSISQNIGGLLYEVIVEERFRHQLGKFYTPEDVVDVLTAFAIRDPNDLVLDPATGGGSFLRSAYARKRTSARTMSDRLLTSGAAR